MHEIIAFRQQRFHSCVGEHLKSPSRIYREIDSRAFCDKLASLTFPASLFLLFRYALLNATRHIASRWDSSGAGECRRAPVQKVVIFGAISCFAVRLDLMIRVPRGRSRLSVAKEVLVPCRGTSQSPALKTEVVHNIVAVGSTTPPPPLPTFFSVGRPLARPPRRTLSSIKAEGIDGEMIEHCAPQCSSMYRPTLRAQPEYVVHRSNWTMIDDVTFLSPLLCRVSSSMSPPPSLVRQHGILLSPASRSSNPPQAEHRIEDAQSSRLSLSFFHLFVVSLFLSSLALSTLFSFLSSSRSSPLPPRVLFYSLAISLPSFSLSFSFSLFLSISLYYFDLLPLLIPALSRSSF
ncbi:hypothetical protein PUN28_008441 [Cardiocondyla obscurior]|uniref:Uncharacterized protein n=1 Tax=Cardiocondyla obscurior TaxID=286306 RepID=A0AAW2FXR6_9HYME